MTPTATPYFIFKPGPYFVLLKVVIAQGRIQVLSIGLGTFGTVADPFGTA
jgi:hypothetical protein